MLSLKLVRSLILGETSNSNSSSSDNETKTPLLLFLPTKEIVKDTYRLATIAREMGMDLYPNPSLSHIIFSWPPSSSSPSSSSSASNALLPSSLWSSTSSSWPSSLPPNFVPLPFPYLITASVTQLRCFVQLSKGLFKLVYHHTNKKKILSEVSNWDCSSLSLFSRVTGDRIDSMDHFSRVLAGLGWTLFKTKINPSLVSNDFGFVGPSSVYLFRKVDSSRVQNGDFRMRELRLPHLDFKNAPLRILHYVLLMTDDVFYLA
ncbi:hypothetical protein MKW92_050718 [Papaver armeniacum]|nr:hypothetical protein MKW92_050718 [Papaver armeniacum]